MQTTTIELIATMGILSIIGLFVLAVTAIAERPKHKPSKGRSVKLR